MSSTHVRTKKTQEVYLHGMDEKWRLPDEVDPTTVEPTPGAIKRLIQVRNYCITGFKNATMLKRQACYMPVMLDGEPLLDRVPDSDNAFIATATAEWGISLGPVIGQQMARMICRQTPTIPLERFRCERIPKGTTIEQQMALQQYMRIMQAQKKPVQHGQGGG